MTLRLIDDLCSVKEILLSGRHGEFAPGVIDKAIAELENKSKVIGHLQAVIDRQSNRITDLWNKLGEWQQATGKSCPSACVTATTEGA